MPTTRPYLQLRDDLVPRLQRFQEQRGLTTQAAALETLVEERLNELVPAVVRKDRVAYVLRPQKGRQRARFGGFIDYEHADDWELGGGRWILDWLVRTEPDWQRKHRVLFPRHWPLQLTSREYRCHNNGGDSRSLMDLIREHIDAPDQPKECRFPDDFETLTTDEWLAICERYRGCCGERIRVPSDPHWDQICDGPDAA